MRRVLLGMLLFGCSSPRPDPAPAGSGSAPVGSSAPVTDAALPDAPAAIDADPFAGYPPRIEAPASKCVLDGEWKDQPKSLALTDGGKPFGEVFMITGARATFGTGVFAEFTTASVRLAGYLDKSKVRIHAAAPFLVAEFAVPGPKLPMKYISTAAEQMTIEVPLPKFARTKSALRTTRACGILAIDDQTEFFPRDGIDVDAQSHGQLRAKQAIALAVEPGKPPVATLTYPAPAPVDVLEMSGKLSRVVVEIGSLNPAEQIVFVGWVQSSAVLAQSGGFGGSWATGGDRPASRTPPSKTAKRVACPNATPLVVELAGERRTVGVVLPNAVMEVLADADLTEVRFAKPDVELAAGARWLVTRAALAGCATAP